MTTFAIPLRDPIRVEVDRAVLERADEIATAVRDRLLDVLTTPSPITGEQLRRVHQVQRGDGGWRDATPAEVVQHFRLGRPYRQRYESEWEVIRP